MDTTGAPAGRGTIGLPGTGEPGLCSSEGARLPHFDTTAAWSVVVVTAGQRANWPAGRSSESSK